MSVKNNQVGQVISSLLTQINPLLRLSAYVHFTVAGQCSSSFWGCTKECQVWRETVVESNDTCALF